MLKIVKNKFVLFAFSLLLFVFVANDFSNQSINNLAVVVAIGIDSVDSLPSNKNDEIEEPLSQKQNYFQMTAELALPTTSDSSLSDNIIVTSFGTSIKECMNNLAIKTGWYPKLNNCSVLLLSQKVCQNLTFDVLNYFLESERFFDSALFCITKDTAFNTLLASAPLDPMSSKGISAVAHRKEVFDNTFVSTNLKDFSKAFYEFGQDGIASNIELNQIDTPFIDKALEQAPTKKITEFDLSSSIIFDQEFMAGTLDKNMTQAFKILFDDDFKPMLTAFDVSIDSVLNGTPIDYVLEVKSIKKDIDVSLKNNTPSLDAKIVLDVIIKDSSVANNSLASILTADPVYKEVLSTINVQLERDCDKLLTYLIEKNSDILAVGKQLNAKDFNSFNNYLRTLNNPNDYLKNLDFNISVFTNSLK